MALHSCVPGIRKEVLYGGKGPRPNFLKNSKAVFHFKTIALLPDGSLPDPVEKDHVIDDSRELGTGPFELLIGREFKLEIWEQLVKDMLIGEVARFSCPYKFVSGYPTVSQALRRHAHRSSHGNDDDHDHTHHCGYSTMMYGTGHKDLDHISKERLPLAFEIELIKVENPDDYKKESWALTFEEKSLMIPQRRAEGNDLYKSGDILAAAAKYFEALEYLESLSIREKPQSSEWDKIEHDKIPLLLNYSQCHLLLKDYPEVIRQTTKVLEIDPNNVKALFRRGKAYSASWSSSEAETDFKKVMELDASLSRTVDKELKALRERMKEKEDEERTRFRGKLF